MQVKRTVKLVTEQSIMYVLEALTRALPVEPSPRYTLLYNKANRIIQPGPRFRRGRIPSSIMVD